jgi:FAD/FMN-containing dehydrogenase
MVPEDALAHIVGSENVTNDPDPLEEWSKDESLSVRIRPLSVVRPQKMEEVRSIVNWANKNGTPLIPVSSGPPHFRGDTIPSVGGAVILDLRDMKKIIRVDRRNRVAMIEPGVTFAQLIPALAEVDLAPFLPLAPRQTKSVVGSLLEREVTTMPKYHWDMQDPLRCVEVVFGTGDLFRTGSATGPGSIQEQWKVGRAQVRPMGPSYTDFAKIIQGSQGSMGIVTWVTVGCRPLPKLKKTLFLGAENIEELIDGAYKIMWKKLGQDLFIINSQNFASLIENDGQGVEALRKELPSWILICSMEGYGVLPEERVAYQENEFQITVQQAGLEPVTVLGGVRSKQFQDVLSKPSEEPYWKMRYKGGCHDIFFLTTLDKTPQFISKMNDLARANNYPVSDMGVYLQPVLQGTNCHCEFSLSYSMEDLYETNIIRRLDSDAVKALVNIGGFFSRPYGSWADYAYGHDSMNVILQRKIKDMFDPEGIMNPGKLCFK